MAIRFGLFLSLVVGFCGVVGENILAPTSSCYDGGGKPTRCEPPRRSFSLDVIPRVNSTCGDPPTRFCYRQVDRLRQIFINDCTGVCNASDPQFSHHAEFMTDFLLNEESWWQSENSISPQQVVMIDMALGSMVEISVIAFNFISPLPNNFYILKSSDFGRTYVPFHYFSSYCIGTYGINPDQVLNSDNETSILCQSIPSPPAPGQISFFPALGRPSSNDSVPGFSEQLYNFITATNISIVLMDHYPIANREIEDFGYYYAIEDLSIIGSCQCHGHASSCSRDPSSGSYQCDCQHNTTGTFCERCADLYQDVPWQISDGNGPFECQECNCNNHSTLCVFNKTIYELNNRSSGGVCINCMHDTSGRHCEECAPYFYPQQGIPFSDPTACIACGCHIPGVTNDGDCARESSINGVQIGDCTCKENVIGRTCSECAPGYFNLSLANPQGCQACECNVTGSMGFECDTLSGECICKPNVFGSKCNSCMEGSYMPDSSSFDGCQPCDCNPGGSSSILCDMNSGQCFCQPGLTGRTCSDIIPGYFFPSIDYLLYEAEYAAGVPNALIVTSGDSGYYQVVNQASNITFGPVIPPMSGFYDIVVRYDLEGVRIWSSASLTISAGSEEGDDLPVCESTTEINGTSNIQYSSWNMGYGLSVSQRVCLQGGRSYKFELSNFDSGQVNGTVNLRIDSVVLIFVNASTLYELLGGQTLLDYELCASYFRSLSTVESVSPSCQQTIFLVSTALYSGAIRCNCSAIGTIPGQVCIAFGGQCPCLPNVQGQQCNMCHPGFHSLSSSGCSACSCSYEGSSSAICDRESGMCDCLNNVVGMNCSECAENYWDLSSGDGCKECSCNMTGAVSLQCDEQSGLCICKPGVKGASCNTCQEQHFGFSQTGCSPCLCGISGSLSSICNNTSGQCQCKQNVEGRDCSQCIEGTYNLQQSNPSGCQPCFCSGQSINCTSANGYAATVISTLFNESAIHGWTTLDNQTSISYNSSVGIILEPNTATYLQAPSIFGGNKLGSYNQYIMVTIDASYTTIRTTVFPADVILLSNEIRVGANFSVAFFNAGLIVLQVHLHESAGWTDMTTNLTINAFSLQSVLSSLDNIYITASYSDPVVINAIKLDTVQQSSVPEDEVPWVEQCLCPLNYKGLSCEQCADGYTRSSNGSCVPCQCNGFSDSCDPQTGACTDCSNYTTGRFCELCQPGTYGEPLQGIPCQLCPCPLTSESGQFSADCSFNVTLGQIVCFNCPPGHTGLQCESCISGYFGDPTGDLTGAPTTCSDCQCNGNINYDNPEACNKTSGICLQCLNNTFGEQCEVCADGYYGDAVVAKNCSVCDCDSRGSNSSSCDSITGECFCLPNVTGRRCTECADGHYSYGSTLGCLPCDCHSEGSENSQCDTIGQCQCRSGVSGLKCDQCSIGYFGLSSEGCRECSCMVSNSVSNSCDENGSCDCQFGAMGRKCGQCVLNYFQTDEGCVLCPDCYEELQQKFLWIKQSFNDSVLRLQQILASFGDEEHGVSDQFADAQEQTSTVLSLVNNTLTRYYSIIVQYEYLISTLNNTLLSQLRQIEVDLSNLRSVSTTVLVLASTSEELMNRTMSDFVATQQALEQILQSMTIFEITQALNMIEENYMLINSIAADLFNSSQMISFQIYELNDLVDSTQMYSKSAASAVVNIQDTITIIESISDSLKLKSASLNSAILSSKGEMEMLLTAIVSLGTLIQQQSTHLPYYAIIEDDLGGLIYNATDTKNHTISDIIPEINSQFNRHTAIYRTISLLMENFNKLESNITNLTSRLSNAYMDLTIQEMKAEQNLMLALATINRAQEILWSLQNFSSESQSISKGISQVVGDAQLIESRARETQNLASNITGEIEQANVEVQNSLQIATSAKDITREAEQIISSLDLPVLIEETEESIEELIMNASQVSVLQNYVISNVSRIDQINSSMENATTLGNSLKNTNSSTTDVVKNLQVNLDTLLDQTLSQNLTVIELLLEHLDDSLSYNATAMYQQLQNMVATQESVRNDFEATLLTLQEQIDYLEHVNSLLPEDCT